MTALSRDEAWTLLCQWTPSEALRTHALSVEAVMRAAARHYGPGAEVEDTWGLAGLLHDADYDSWPDEHPQRIVAWLRERGEHDLAHAVSAHYTRWGVPCDALLDRALLACDELTGFVGACCHVRPGGISALKVRSVVKSLKRKDFAAKVERHEVYEGVRLLDEALEREVTLDDHIAFVIDALRPHGEELGLLGRAPADAG